MADIKLDGIVKEFPVGDSVEVAVNEIDLEIADGEFVCLVGPSGCGKTTTLRCIAGLEQPTRGQIYINDEDITNQPPQERDLSMVFQSIALYPTMSVRENVAYPLKLDGVSKDKIEEKVHEATSILQIEEYLDKNPNDLSGGQAQRVSLARALVRDPAAFLLDEPMSDLDAKLKMEMRKEIGKIHKEIDATMVYVTHDQEEAMTLADKIAVMNDGDIEQFGSPGEIYRDPANVFVSKFIGSPSINLIDATLERSSATDFTLQLDSDYSVVFTSDKDKLSTDDFPQDVLLGFRPPHTKVDERSSPGIEATVVLNEQIGDDVIQYLETPFGELRSVVPFEGHASEGSEVSVQIQTSGIYVFDQETGAKLVRGDPQKRTEAVQRAAV